MATFSSHGAAGAFLIAGVLLFGTAHADTKTIAPFIDGMSITTSDSVATVDIRAQSLGPGFCAVEFSAGGNTVPLLAPPLKYTAWTVLASHIGSVGLTITDDVKCDTGVIAQISYYPKARGSSHSAMQVRSRRKRQ